MDCMTWVCHYHTSTFLWIFVSLRILLRKSLVKRRRKLNENIKLDFPNLIFLEICDAECPSIQVSLFGGQIARSD